MDNQKVQKEIKELQAQFTKLQSDVSNLTQSFFKNNFSSSQVFNKDSIFTTRLQVPIYTSQPAVSEVGDLICINLGGGDAKLYICTVANTTFELVGSQV